MKFYLVKTISGQYKPAYDSDKEISNKVPLNEIIEAEFIKKRNYLFHKKYFKLLDIAFDNQELISDRQLFREALTVLSGYFTEYKSYDGSINRVAKSISFNNMDQIEFERLYQKTIDTILKYILKDTTEQELLNEIVSFT